MTMAAEDKETGSPNIDDSQLEREILQERKFSWAEAIARQAGKNLLKGASPVTTQRQAELVIERFLEQNLADAEGALRKVLQRRVSHSELLFRRNYQQPLTALAEFVDRLLTSEGLLEDFVRAVDAEWGRLYDERPQFQKHGDAPQAGDSYTFTSVREQLTGLLELLRGK